MNPSDLVETFIASRRAAHMSPHTVNWYGWMLRPYATAVGDKTSTAAIAAGRSKPLVLRLECQDEAAHKKTPAQVVEVR